MINVLLQKLTIQIMSIASIKVSKKLLAGSLFGLSMFLAAGFVFAPKAFAADTTAPKIIDPKMFTIDAPLEVDFSWKTNEKTNGKIEYGTTSGSYTSSVLETDSVLEMHTGLIRHNVLMTTGLAYGTTYYFRIQATDLFGNIANSKEFSWKTPVRELKINSVKVLDVNANSAIIQVSFNRKGTISVSAKNESGETVGESYILEGEESFAVRGKVILKGLVPNTSYVVSIAGWYTGSKAEGNPVVMSTSVINVLTTTPVPEITKINKSKGGVGSIISIYGKNFGKDLGLPAQKLVAAVGCPIDWDETTYCAAEIISWTDSEIQVRITNWSKSGIIHLMNAYNSDIPYINEHYFPAVVLPWPNISNKGNALFLFSVTDISGKAAVAKACGCGFSTTARKATSRYAKNIRVKKVFHQGDSTDAYFKSVYDLYEINWKRAPRCEELQFHYDHKTSLQKLTAWLKGGKPKN